MRYISTTFTRFASETIFVIPESIAWILTCLAGDGMLPAAKSRVSFRNESCQVQSILVNWPFL
jgi:hypothetical protein